MKFPAKSLEEWIEVLDSQGALIQNDREVDLRNEVSSIAKKTSQTQGPAVLHDQIHGYPEWRVFHDGFATRERIAWAFGMQKENFLPNIIAHLHKSKPIKPTVLPTGPCKEIKINGDDIDLTYMPIPFTGEFEGPPFITAGISNIRDPDTGWQNTGIRRFQLKGKRKINNLILPFQHEAMIFRKYIQKNQPAPLAIVIGADPIYYLASQIPAPAQVDEMDMWGAIAGEPLEVVRCENSEILVPARAEIILEGEMDPVAREFEGSFPEFSGYYSAYRYAPVVHIKTITMRKRPIYYYMYNGAPVSEGLTIGSTMNEMELYRQLKEAVPEVVDVALLSNWGGMTVVSIGREAKKRSPGLAKRIAFVIKTLKASPFVKHVVIVDDDIDVRDPNQVLWSFCTRFQAAKDITVIPGSPGNFLDPSEPWLGLGPGFTSYTIFECTEKLPPHDIGYRRGLARPAADVWERIMGEWTGNGFRKEGAK